MDPDPNFNVADWLVDRQVREGRGDAIAVEAGSGTLSYAELANLTGKVAAGLHALGMHRDDRVVFVTSDDIAMFAGILGAIRGGYVAVPISTMLGAAELADIIRDSGAVMLVTSTPFADKAAQAANECPDLGTVVWDGPPAETPLREGLTGVSFEELVAAGDSADVSWRDPRPVGHDSWALWLYTSGTTGKPKGAMHRHQNLRLVAECYGWKVLGITPQDRCYSIAKLFFAYGIGNSMFIPLSVGATTILEAARPTAEVVAARVAQSRPTLFFGVPALYIELVNSSIPDDTFDGVRWGVSAGELLPEGIQAGVKFRFDLDILDGLGSTEALHIFLSNRPGDIRPSTSGRPVPGYQLELRDLNDKPVPDGTPGTLYVHGGSVALGYWRRAQATREVFQGSWLNTGDTYVRSPDGYYTCLGRVNDVLKAGGIWVSPFEVEKRLLEHPAVEQCAIVGVRDQHGLEMPVAVVVARQAVSADELEAWCREGLAAFKRPRRFFFIDELPRTATGKLQRYLIRGLVDTLIAESAEAPEPTSAPGRARADQPRAGARMDG